MNNLLISIVLALIALLLATTETRVASLSNNRNIRRNIPLGTLSVSPIAVGTLNFDKEQAKSLLQTLPANTLIDSAEIYCDGKAEESIALALDDAGLKFGKDVFSATKFAPQIQRRDVNSVVSACKESCRRLGVDCIDLYQIHYSDSLQPMVGLGIDKNKDEIYWDGLAECYHKGLASNIGVCNYGPTMIRRAHEALQKRGVPLVSNQIGFNLMRYGVTKETKDICDELSINVMAYSPLAKGVISGKYSHTDEKLWEKFESRYRYYRFNRCIKSTIPLQKTLQRISESRGKPWSQVVYNWSIYKGAIPISGARDKEQATDISEALGWSLTDVEVEELDAVCCDNVSPSKEFALV